MTTTTERAPGAGADGRRSGRALNWRRAVVALAVGATALVSAACGSGGGSGGSGGGSGHTTTTARKGYGY